MYQGKRSKITAEHTSSVGISAPGFELLLPYLVIGRPLMLPLQLLAVVLAIHCKQYIPLHNCIAPMSHPCFATADFCAGDSCHIHRETTARRAGTQTQTVQRGGGKQLLPAAGIHQPHHRGGCHGAVCSSVCAPHRAAASGLQLCCLRISDPLYLVLQLGKPRICTLVYTCIQM